MCIVCFSEAGFVCLLSWWTIHAAFPRVVDAVTSSRAARGFSRTYSDGARQPDAADEWPTNPLCEYFEKHTEGHGIWKWQHYFEVYHRHFAHFVGRKVNVLEIGVYSGGSLEMWRSYFGNDCHIYGVDIEDACRAYANEHISIFIGDQEDRSFWKRFRETAGPIDILIDDGGHTFEQQQVTLEEMLPALNPGGVYLCEDIHGKFNKFSAYASGLVNELNHMNCISESPVESDVSAFQSAIHSIHFYPYVLVIEKRSAPLTKLSSLKHGTIWQPFPCG